MGPKLALCGSLVALALAAYPLVAGSRASPAPEPASSLVLRAELPIAGAGAGHFAFATTLAGARWELKGAWSADGERTRFGFGVAKISL
ncbi:MAG TPA: hypothetical protein VGI39_45965 [Polyangiaceae bacterium]